MILTQSSILVDTMIETGTVSTVDPDLARGNYSREEVHN